MGITIEQHRICFGCHLNKCSKASFYFWTFVFPRFVLLFVIAQILRCCNDIETNPGPITICQANVQSLMALPPNTPKNSVTPPKIIQLELLSNSDPFDILCLTESWLGPNYTDKDISIAGFPQVKRRDRGSRGGGVVMYCKENIIIKRLREIEPSDSEILCLDLLLPDSSNKHVLLATCYRPDDRYIVDFICDLQDIFEYSLKMKYHQCIFVGDFNCKNSEWFSD